MSAVKTVAITRSGDDAAEFVRLAEEHGMRPIALPTIQLTPRGEGIADEFLAYVKEYDPDYTVFMSSKAVRLLFEAAKKNSKVDELRLAVANTAVVAVGPKTAAALKECGVRVLHVPDEVYSSVGVGELFTKLDAVGRRVLVPRSGASTPFLGDLLKKIGLDVRELHMYDVRAAGSSTEWKEFGELLVRGSVDGVVFTSASSVRAFFEIMSREGGTPPSGLESTRVVAIGPFTADELEKFGVRCTISQVHTVPGAFEAMRAELGWPARV